MYSAIKPFAVDQNRMCCIYGIPNKPRVLWFCSKWPIGGPSGILTKSGKSSKTVDATHPTREIRLHLLPELGDVQFEEVTPAVLRAVLKKKAEQGLRRQTLNHLKGYLTDICKCAVAEGYLENNISERLKAPVKLARPSDVKLTVQLDRYAEAWKLLGERNGCVSTW